MNICADGHSWVRVDERHPNGYMIVPVPRPYLWECAFCDVTHRGDVAPDGKTADQAFEEKCDALDRADRADV